MTRHRAKSSRACRDTNVQIGTTGRPPLRAFSSRRRSSRASARVGRVRAHSIQSSSPSWSSGRVRACATMAPAATVILPSATCCSRSGWAGSARPKSSNARVSTADTPCRSPSSPTEAQPWLSSPSSCSRRARARAHRRSASRRARAALANSSWRTLISSHGVSGRGVEGVGSITNNRITAPTDTLRVVGRPITTKYESTTYERMGTSSRTSRRREWPGASAHAPWQALPPRPPPPPPLFSPSLAAGGAKCSCGP